MKLKWATIFFLVLSTSVVFFVGGAAACSCMKEQTPRVRYDNARSVVHVRMLKSELSNISDFNGLDKLVKGSYEVIETFKGKPSKEGAVISTPWGPGTCFVPLYPGVHYLFFLTDKAKISSISVVTMCDGGSMTFNTKSGWWQEKLTELRGWAKQAQ